MQPKQPAQPVKYPRGIAIRPGEAHNNVHFWNGPLWEYKTPEGYDTNPEMFLSSYEDRDETRWMAWGARGVPVPGCPFASREEAQRVLEEEAASLGFCVVAIGIVEDPQRAARLAQIRGIAATAKAVSIATGKGGGETDLDFLLSEIDRLGVEVERLKKLVGEK